MPEHTHIPSSRKSEYPVGGALIRLYYEIIDPFLVLNLDSQKPDRVDVRLPEIASLVKKAA